MCLNYNQKKAIYLINKPCFILAGAGSGKTKVIVNKIIYLIKYCNYKAKNIAAITFTNKAANEMKNRVFQILNYKENSKIIITTFHSLGLKIIKYNYKNLNIKNKLILLNRKDQIILLKKLIPYYFLNNKKFLKKFIFYISNYKNYLTLFKKNNKNFFYKDIILFNYLYKIYESHLIKCNILDFDDLIYKSVKILKNNFLIRKYWQNKLKYILIDEYQDTNFIQYQLIKLLTGSSKKFTIVGDDDQSIYSWRGAQPKNLLLLKKDFPKLKLIKLEQNYRSTKRIINAANIIISNNLHFYKKKLYSNLNYGKKIKVIKNKNKEEEASKVIINLLKHNILNKTRYSDYAILYRENNQSKLFEKNLLYNCIPYCVSGNGSFFSKLEIKNIIFYLRLFVNLNDDNAFLNIINVPKRKIGLITLKKLIIWAKNKNTSLFNSILDKGLEEIFNKHTLKLLRNFNFWFNKIILKYKTNFIKIIDNILIDIDYKNWLIKTSSCFKKAKIKINNVNNLINWINKMINGSNLNNSMKLEEIIDCFVLHETLYVKKNKINQVQLMTLHASKGLEFSYVFLVGMEEGNLPHKNSIDINNIEEERRLVYVGITRAKKELTLTLCNKKYQYGKLIKLKPSRFLLELPQKDLLWN